MKNLRFLPDRGFINALKLREVNYPETKVPESYLCNIQFEIMSAPVEQKGLGFVDIASVEIHKQHNQKFEDVVTRESQSDQPKVNEEMLDKIELFVKKIHLIYYLFQRNDAYKTLYTEPMIQAQLSDEALSYDEFKRNLKSILISRENTSAPFFSSANDYVLPPMQVCELFDAYEIPTLLPSEKDYEILLRRIAGRGQALDLHELLNSPVLDAMNINIDAKSSNGLDASGWIDEGASRCPEKKDEYQACRKVLSDYKSAHNTEISESSSNSLGSKK